MSQKALELLKARFSDAVLDSGSMHGDEWAKVKPAAVADIATWLRDDPAQKMEILADITAVDFMNYDPAHPLSTEDAERFEVVYSFLSISTHQRLRLKVRVGGEQMSIPTLDKVYRTANWWERLVFDFYGVTFEGHPHLRRILTYDSFKGHPLRKDYPIHLRQPLTPERDVKDLVRGPGPGTSDRHSPFSQRPGARPNTRSDAYD
jgi:NADH-quinone oxidoreductase subunit C